MRQCAACAGCGRKTELMNKSKRNMVRKTESAGEELAHEEESEKDQHLSGA